MNWSYLKTCGKPIVLYGMGNGADRILDALEKKEIPAAGVFASDEFARGQCFRGFPVCTYSQAKEHFGNMVVLLAFGSGRPEVLERISAIAAEQELYAPDFPVVPGPAVDSVFLEQYGSRLQKIYEQLSDDQSRLVFSSLLEYKQTGNIQILRGCETPPEESYRQILKLQPGDILADLGAYRGDTAAEFIRYCPEYGGIYAFEPDAYTFRHLQKNAESWRNCKLFQTALSDRTGTVSFAGRGGRNSAVCGAGVPVPCDTLDHLLAGSPVTFLNIDVEGQESAALSGAVDTIRRNHPKLLVAAYHRNEDLFQIPEQLLAIQPDYRVYLRHYPQLPAWDVNYYFV